MHAPALTDRPAWSQPLVSAAPDLSAAEAHRLIVAVAERADREAFAALFEHYAPRIKGYLVRRGLEPGRAEEVTQECMLAVWRKARQFDPARADASAWIFAIARNLRVDEIRRERRPELAGEAAEIAEPARAEEQLLRTDAARSLHAAMAELPPEQTEALRAVYFDDHAHGAAAQALDVPLGTLKSRVRLALQRLRSRLETLQ